MLKRIDKQKHSQIIKIITRLLWLIKLKINKECEKTTTIIKINDNNVIVRE